MSNNSSAKQEKPNLCRELRTQLETAQRNYQHGLIEEDEYRSILLNLRNKLKDYVLHGTPKEMKQAKEFLRFTYSLS